MESLTLNDAQSYHRHQDQYRSKDQRHCSSRLPTPETSRSSNDSQSPSDSDLPDRSSVLRFGSEAMSDGSGYLRRDSRYSAGQYSPPYRSGDMQRPSLPPIKTVLGDNIASPPTTPSPHGTPMQPSPHEPNYTALTYKPPSLYPNKKQRVEQFPSLGPQYATTTKPGSQFGPTANHEPQANGSATRHYMQFPPMSQLHVSGVGSRPATISTAPCALNSPPWSSQYPPSKSAPASHYHTPVQTPTSAVMEPLPRMCTFAGPVQDPFAREMRESFAHNGDRAAPRRVSTSAYGTYASRPYEREPRPAPYHQNVRYSAPVREAYPEHRDSIRYGRIDEQQPRSFGQNAYHQGNVPSFFMPSHYEYQHGKARKRSNLPKQSTEIMKTWFDQNIANPYPSEEQKAVFASATGISLTQVSNWFINHRRRCPELRDKRERIRGEGRDGDM